MAPSEQAVEVFLLRIAGGSGVVTSSTVSDDLELLRRWREGDDAAGETLIRAHYPAVFRLVLREVGGASDLAADLTQAVFETVLDKRDDIMSNVGGYLRGIARRKVQAHFRKKKEKDEDLTVSRLMESAVGAVSVLMQDENNRLLARALRSLSAEDQMYMYWMYVEELSQNAIAERVGLTRSQVNGKISRAREKLRRELEALAASERQRSAVIGGFDTWMTSLLQQDESKAHKA